MILAIGSGLIGGMQHVLSGPDHLAAVAPLAVAGRRDGWITGLMWGIGHSLGVWALAIVAVLVRELLPLESLSGWAEFLVGFILLGIGAWGLWRVYHPTVTHDHAHQHGDFVHSHLHGESHHHEHDHEHAPDPNAQRAGRGRRAALGVGLLHGVAGTNHLIFGLLPVLAFKVAADRFGYVLAYGVGSIVAMTAFAAVIALVVRRLEIESAAACRGLLLICSLGAIGVGGYWLYLGFSGPA